MTTFWLDKGLGSELYLDGVVTVFDGKNGLNVFDMMKPTRDTAVRQVALADVIIVNKMDSIDTNTAEIIEKMLTGINTSARIIQTTYAKVDLNDILELKAYSKESAKKPSVITNIIQNQGAPHIDQCVTTLNFDPGIMTRYELELFMENLLWKDALKETSPKDILQPQIYRSKGIINAGDHFLILQSVYETYEIEEMRKIENDGKVDQSPTSSIVFIGQCLKKEKIIEVFENVKKMCSQSTVKENFTI